MNSAKDSAILQKQLIENHHKLMGALQILISQGNRLEADVNGSGEIMNWPEFVNALSHARHVVKEIMQEETTELMRNPLWVFAQECGLGAYSEAEIPLAARKAMKHFIEKDKNNAVNG